MPENQHKSSNPESSGSDKNASKKEEGKDSTLDDIVEDLSSYFKKYSHFTKYEKDIKRKYKKYYNTTLPDRWPVEFINKAWRKTKKHMYTFSARRKCWSLAILLQVMKRSQGYDEREETEKKQSYDESEREETEKKQSYDESEREETEKKHSYDESEREETEKKQSYDESEREETQSDLKEDNQQSGGDPSANKPIYIRIPFAEMIDNEKCKASETDKNATKTDKNGTKTDKKATKTDENTSETDKNATKTDENDKKCKASNTVAMEIVKSPNENSYKLIDKVPSPTQILQNKFYITLYDNRTRNAAWVYEILNKSPKSNKNVYRENFKGDTLVHPLFRPSMDTDKNPYENTGYNRGHLAAAANHKWCQGAYNDTFFISNTVPQQRDFNNEYWSDLEELCREIAQKEEVRNVHVYTGPLYLSSNEKDNNDQNKSEKRVEYKFLGGKAVPTHLFKVIIVENNDGEVLKPECYKMPNEKLLYIKIKSSDKTKKIVDLRTSLKKYYKSIEEIQKDSGLIFEERGIREEMEDGTWKVHRRKGNPDEEGKGTKIEVTVSGSYTDHSDRAVLY